jgi:hypothetical protein
MPESVDVVLEGDSMWPTFSNGDVLGFHLNPDPEFVAVNDVLLVKHPFKPTVLMVKRLIRIEADGRLFVAGDQCDPTASEDSHNFGSLRPDHVLGVWNGEVKRA